MFEQNNPPVLENPLPEPGQYTNTIGYRRDRTDLKTLAITAATLLVGVSIFCWVTGTKWGGYSAIRGPKKHPMTAVCKCNEGHPKHGGCEFYWGDESQ